MVPPCIKRITEYVDYWFDHVDDYATYGLDVDKGDLKIILSRGWCEEYLEVKKKWKWFLYKREFKIRLDYIEELYDYLNDKWHALDIKCKCFERNKKRAKQLAKLKRKGYC